MEPTTSFPKRRVASLYAALALSVAAGIGMAPAQTVSQGRLDFLKSKDPTIALFANTSAGGAGKIYSDELVLLTGLPSNPAISARVDLLGSNKPRCPGNCGGLRNVVLSPDGDTALVSSDPHDNMVSSLFLLRNVKTFARTKDPADLQIRVFTERDFPQLDNVSGLAFGTDGTWAVVNTAGPSPIDGSYRTAKGTIVLITGLPDNPVFSAPFPVPMHSQGNIDLSLDGDTLLLNDTSDFSGIANGGPRSNQIVVRGIRPGSAPRVAGISSFSTPMGFPAGPPPVRDARLSLDGRWVIAPIPLASQLDGQKYVALNQIAILGPAGRETLQTARLMSDTDGVSGGPFQAAVSPNGDTALIANVLDNGSAQLLTGLSSGDPAKLKLTPLPFPFFGPPFPLGPAGPEVLAPHGQPIFTADGDSAVVVNWLAPTVPFTASPSLSFLTGFESGNIRVAANLTDPALNPVDQRQQIATFPAGLLDYIKLYLPPGADRDALMNEVNLTIDRSDLGPLPDGGLLVNFIYDVAHRVTTGTLKRSQAATLLTLGTAGLQSLWGHTENVPAAGFGSRAVAPGSIASLSGERLTYERPPASSPAPAPTSLNGVTVTLFDSAGVARDAPLLMVSKTQIGYLVPAGMEPGRATALVRDGGDPMATATFEVEVVSPGLFTTGGAGVAAAAVQRFKADGSQTVEPVTGPIDLTGTDRVYLLLFGTGIRNRSSLAAVKASIAGMDVDAEFAGPQGQFEGLDQVNLRLPPSLAGAGEVQVSLVVDGRESNKVTVTVR